MSEYYVLKLKTALRLATAEKIIDGALAAGEEAGLLPLTVAVLA